ncbi:hypothetical protein ABTM50_20940, partial [Acinetobacter baumannii]
PRVLTGRARQCGPGGGGAAIGSGAAAPAMSETKAVRVLLADGGIVPAIAGLEDWSSTGGMDRPPRRV